ncbi:hypothetical protein LEP1GSC127_0507 [Leptospira kirschneri str. 200801925]|uniref:Uncharacterized protein n=2 Tax=Leptospira TaxID=171 RepID=M6H6R1_LEPIR|nr:hypothetical protein LEP1GSC044_0551 [Leptospira kirschneri serovar Grippotyphosa str. RM52]EKO53823.1 hypothetical protein LEP1GSC131_3069 [Leptospira kirschneri str. 200802841]EKQ85464.1 hypothetical protein LEP1GSC064_0677 [Leptospira kirschneri serovar Grippotyphosa str. Moskva]EKR09409.1 hypothetical protein LEP1GSC122_0285 [Leptospira kirschneri serovar Valbuzzi str. 200702274]EMK06342.1 hypothetical protein LEP1GSC176_3680 [Leptospira kirschneri str. MMD1493]EMK14161.1 hypothetical p
MNRVKKIHIYKRFFPFVLMTKRKKINFNNFNTIPDKYLRLYNENTKFGNS